LGDLERIAVAVLKGVRPDLSEMTFRKDIATNVAVKLSDLRQTSGG